MWGGRDDQGKEIRGLAMDVWVLNLHSGGGLSVFGATTRKHEKRGLLVALRPTAAGWMVVGGQEVPAGGIEASFRGPCPSASKFRSVVVRAGGKKNNHGDSSSAGKGLRFSLRFYYLLWELGGV